jgi:hypothetical protein
LLGVLVMVIGIAYISVAVIVTLSETLLTTQISLNHKSMYPCGMSSAR